MQTNATAATRAKLIHVKSYHATQNSSYGNFAWMTFLENIQTCTPTRTDPHVQMMTSLPWHLHAQVHYRHHKLRVMSRMTPWHNYPSRDAHKIRIKELFVSMCAIDSRCHSVTHYFASHICTRPFKTCMMSPSSCVDHPIVTAKIDSLSLSSKNLYIEVYLSCHITSALWLEVSWKIIEGF